jgi:Na+/melibiose symporter-like transporter
MLMKWLITTFGKLLPIRWTGIAAIATFVLALVAITPILKDWIYKKKYRVILRTQMIMELTVLLWGFKNKLVHIAENPEKGTARQLNSEDQKAILQLEELFKNAAYLSRKESNLFQLLLKQFRENSFAYRRDGLDKDGIELLKDIVERLIGLLNIELNGTAGEFKKK